MNPQLYAQAPLLDPTTSNYAQEDRILKTSVLTAQTVTDGIATISDGQLLNLVYPPLNPKDAATVQYVNNTTYAGGVTGSVQYNSNSVFSGSPNLMFDGATLTINGTYTDSIFSIAGQSINNLNNPVNPTDIATKGYVDKFAKTLVPKTINSDTSQVYAAVYMVNGIILRNSLTLSNVTLTDFTDTAANIIQKYPGSVVGSVVRFTLQNANNTGVSILLSPGHGLVFKSSNTTTSSITIGPNYTLYARLIITNKTYGSQTVTMNIDSVSYTMAYMSPFFVNSQEPEPSYFTALVASTEALTLSGLQTVDSYGLQTNDRVLVKNQANTVDNGIYIASETVWARSSDLATGSNAFNINIVISGTVGVVNEGLIFNAAPYVDPLTVGSHNITFSTDIQNSVESFSTSEPYKATNVFLEPVLSSTISTTVNYMYTAADIASGLVIRNPATSSNDTIEDFSASHTLFEASSFIINNISSSTITLANSVNWTYVPSSVSIGPTTSALFWINMNNGSQILNSIGKFDL